MALPADITTTTLTFGPYYDSHGASACPGLTITITPDRRVTHVGDGSVILPAPLKLTLDATSSGSIVLPNTDCPTLSASFVYVISVAYGNGKVTPPSQTIALPTTAGPTVDYDGLTPSVAPGAVVPVPVATTDRIDAAVSAATSAASSAAAAVTAVGTVDTDVRANTTAVVAAVGATTTAQQATNATLTATLNPTGTAITVSGTRDRFRDGFTSGALPDPAVWTLVNDAPDAGNGQGHLVLPGGDSQGSAYLRASLSPFAAGAGVQLASVASFAIPIRHAWGISMSQRNTGQEVLFGLAEGAGVGGDALGLNRLTQTADLAISGTVTTTGTNATVVFAAPHGLKGNDRVVLYGNARRELNVGPVYATITDALTITVPCTLAAATYPAGGFVRLADPSANVNNAALQLWGDNTSVTNATYVTRRNGTKARIATSQGSVSSGPTQANGSPYSDAWLALGPAEIWANIDEVVWRSWTDGSGGTNGYSKFQQSIPDETLNYRLYARAKNLDNLSRPIARVASITKSASATATVTTDVPHGLAVNDNISIIGVRDQVNFVSAGAILVASVIDATHFTTTFGAIATATDSLGGVVWLNHGGIAQPGNVGQYVQSVACANAGVLQVVGNVAWSGVGPGDTVNLYGLNPATQVYEGAYLVRRLNGTTMDLTPLATSWNGTTFTSTNTGGQLIRRTDVRFHFARILAHTRMLTEVIGGRGGTTDVNNAVPVSITSAASVPVNATLQNSVTEFAPATATNLGASAVFTQTANDTGASVNLRSGNLRVVVSHTAGQVHGQLTLEQSTDNFVTFRETHRIPVPSDGLFHTLDLPLTQRYYRLKFTNGTTAQTNFYLGATAFRGEPNRDANKNLSFPLTAVAGQALALSAVFSSPVVDLGPNHSWQLARLYAWSDQASAANGIYIQQSMDGAGGWTNITNAANGANGGVLLEEKITCRYLRAVYNNSTVAATAFRLNLSLLSL